MGLVNKGADDDGGNTAAGGYLGDTRIVQIAPAGLTTAIVEIPTIIELAHLQPTSHHLVEHFEGSRQVVGVDMLLPLLVANALVRQHVTVEFVSMMLANVPDDDVVSTALQSLLHHGVGEVGLLRTLAHTAQNDAVGHKHANKQCHHRHRQQEGNHLGHMSL